MNSASPLPEASAAAPVIRAVFFDAVGTLIHPRPSVGEVYARVGRQFGADLPSDLIEQRFRVAFRRQEELDNSLGLRTSELRERERWRSIVTEVFHDQPDPTAPLATLWEHFGRPEAWAVYPDVSGCLAVLRSRGLMWGIASNFDSRLRAVVAGLPELHTCATLVVSSEVGWRKPAPQFFASLLTKAEHPAAQLLLVGDDLANDYEGGRAAGLATVLLARKQSNHIGDAIRSLAELPRLLDVETESLRG